MNIRHRQFSPAAAVLAAALFSISTAHAQGDSSTAGSAPQLPYGTAQIIQLSQAKVNDDTIITYINSSGNSYGLNADQIIYLQQQGVSSAVINTMLNQPKAGVLAAAPAVSTAQSSTAPAAVTVVQPQPVTAYYYSTPAPVYYSRPYSYYYYSYPYYGWNPGVTLSFGWHGGWRGGGYYGGGFHGGFHGGWHR